MNEENTGTAETAAPTSHTIYCCQGRVSYPQKTKIVYVYTTLKENWFGHHLVTSSSFHPMYGLDEVP